VLEVTDLTRTYGQGATVHLAIENVTLSVADGELVTIVGPSGCGKSTLLRCIGGLLTPTSGSIVLNGVPVTRVPDRLAVVFQDYSRSLYPWLSVTDNVALPLRRTVRSRADRRQAALAALEAVGLTSTAHRYPWQLSGGMQQRVAIARALACDPVLLLMDEPFGSVDAQTREDLEDLVLRVRAERGITILLVTHDIDESVYTGDRVIVLTPGPGRIRASLPVGLPTPRDQIATKELPEFVHLRTEVSRLVRGQTVSAGGPAGRPALRGWGLRGHGVFDQRDQCRLGRFTVPRITRDHRHIRRNRKRLTHIPRPVREVSVKAIDPDHEWQPRRLEVIHRRERISQPPRIDKHHRTDRALN
jgi:NitT/TauT family transport system ATP-binding protein